MKYRGTALRGLFALSLLAAPTAQALEIEAGDWKFSFSGNVNVHYISSQCEDSPQAIVTVGGACTAGGDTEDQTSSISNGLLPAAFVFGASTVQKGWDIAANLGLYPGVSTNDGGSPNLQQDGPALGANTGLGTTGLDVRQVFMTFGKKDLGTFTLGRNFGLFGFDSIINDMTIPGVGAGNGSYGAPANTSLGSIGFGYVYTDTLAQMNYTTPDMAGLKLTIGIFDPVEPLLQGTPTPEASPGFHGKAAYTAGNLYLSASFLSQKHEGVSDASDFDSTAFDIGGKYKAGAFEVMAFFYTGEGLGTTALYTLSDDGAGNERDSDGFLAQIAYTISSTKIGLNYGESNLDHANAADELATPNLLEKNSKYTLGVYHSLTPNLTLVAEFSDLSTEAHNGNENQSSNFNVGAFLSF